MKPDLSLKGKSGIYKIINLVNSKIYIGRTKCLYRRCHHYVYDFKNRRSRQINEYLLRSMTKHGLENFSFEVIEFCELDIIEEREYYWMHLLNSIDRNSGYNLRQDSSGGMITSESTSKKISERLKTEWKNGKRSGHSDKLKLSWNTRNREIQSKLFSKIKTKYTYSIDNSEELVDYKYLIEHGYKNVLSTFNRKQSDEVIFKGVLIRRFKLNES